MLGEVSKMRSVLLQAEERVENLQKEMDQLRSGITADEAKYDSMERMSRELEAENARLRA